MHEVTRGGAKEVSTRYRWRFIYKEAHNFRSRSHICKTDHRDSTSWVSREKEATSRVKGGLSYVYRYCTALPHSEFAFRQDDCSTQAIHQCNVKDRVWSKTPIWIFFFLTDRSGLTERKSCAVGARRRGSTQLWAGAGYCSRHQRTPLINLDLLLGDDLLLSARHEFSHTQHNKHEQLLSLTPVHIRTLFS